MFFIQKNDDPVFHVFQECTMPRQHKRREGARKYGFATDSMQRALADVQDK